MLSNDVTSEMGKKARRVAGKKGGGGGGGGGKV